MSVHKIKIHMNRHYIYQNLCFYSMTDIAINKWKPYQRLKKIKTVCVT